jgi:hypothetical protein
VIEWKALADRFGRYGGSMASSPMYADLMSRCALDIVRGGPVARAMAAHEGAPGSAPPMRLLGAVHRLVLAGAAPGLAPFYPSVGGVYDGDRAWPAFLAVVSAGVPGLDRTVQTNEVGRAAALVGGFHAVSLAYRRPLRLLEVGASAGLLLRFDSYRYDGPSVSWGDSPLRLAIPDLPLDPALRVAERRGCDRSPIDPASEDGRLTLLSYVWADQAARIERLRAALDVAARVPVAVDEADAVGWVRDRLREPSGDAVPVVYHSVVMQYLAPAAREAFAAAVTEAEGPRAWLRFEPEGAEYVVRLTTWPGGDDRVLATAHPHGYDVRWLAT